VSLAVGAGSLRIWLLSGMERQRDERLEPAVSSCSARARSM
jgi:hypothetical protein